MTINGFVLATSDGLVITGPDGSVRTRELTGTEITAVAADRDALVIATREDGVLCRSTSDAADRSWRSIGLAGETIWTVARGGAGRTYVGLEPAALWCVDDAGARELSGLGTVDGSEDWHSPWGPADLCSIWVEPDPAGRDRILVGIEVGGVAVSEDGGETFEARNEGLYEDVHRVVADGADWFATTGMGVHRSRDAGSTWAWVQDGIDRGYTQGLAIIGDAVLVAASSGPPPLWEADGPEAAVFRAVRGATGPLDWQLVLDEFEGNVERQALIAHGDHAAAATTAGELFVSADGGRTWALTGVHPPITAVAALAD